MTFIMTNAVKACDLEFGVCTHNHNFVVPIPGPGGAMWSWAKQVTSRGGSILLNCKWLIMQQTRVSLRDNVMISVVYTSGEPSNQHYEAWDIRQRLHFYNQGSTSNKDIDLVRYIINSKNILYITQYLQSNNKVWISP